VNFPLSLPKRSVACILLLTLAFTASALAAGPKNKIIYNFTGGLDGSEPFSGLTPGANGILYGTTENDGSLACMEGGSCGVVYSLTPPQSGGSWTQSVLWDFSNSDTASSPPGGVVFDRQGNLYGAGLDTVYQLVPGQGGGSWTFNSIYSSNSGFVDTPTVDAAGNVYVASTDVFELSPTSGGLFTAKTISTEGGIATFAMDKSGSLYGEGPGGLIQCGSLGTTSCGVVYKLSPQSDGTWTYSIIYEFTSAGTGANPANGLTIDAKGHLFGTAPITNSICIAAATCSVAFELSPPAVQGGKWTKTVLHTFEGGSDGSLLYGALAVDSKENVYGTSSQGGSGFCSNVGCGTVFQLKPPATEGGAWSETLYSFQGGSDGSSPHGSLLLSSRTGVLTGTTVGGGAYNRGTIFQIFFP
jgi:hypothetical protein